MTFANSASTKTPALPRGQTHGEPQGPVFPGRSPAAPLPRGRLPTTPVPPRRQNPLGNLCHIILALALAWLQNRAENCRLLSSEPGGRRRR